MLIYATTADLETYTGVDAPDNADALLRSASRRIGRATRGAVYVAQSNGMPEDDDLIDALRDATCALVQTWVALGVDPVTGAAGARPVKTASSVDGASITLQVAAGQADTIAAAATELSDEAYEILADAGLLSNRVVSFG